MFSPYLRVFHPNRILGPGGGSPKGWVHNLPMQLFTLGISNIGGWLLFSQVHRPRPSTRGRCTTAPVPRGARRAVDPPNRATAQQAKIASLRRRIASLEGVINTLRREAAESRGQPASTRPRAAAAAPAAWTTTVATAKATTTTANAAADKTPASTSKAAAT